MTATTGEKILKNALNEQLNSLDCIETNLWLGNLSAATDTELLKEKGIKFILTVNSFPLPKEVASLSYIRTEFIKVCDTSRDDILSYFEQTYKFIENAVKKGTVLVHCFHGVSRSPTIIISYLMKKKSMTMKEALGYVKSKRECVGPNPGFLAQLQLYEIMQWTVDKNNIQYKMFRLYITVEYVKKANAVPEHCADVIKIDPLSMKTVTDPTMYRCKKCRRVVALSHNAIPHIPGEKYSWRNSKWSKCSGETEFCKLAYFIEPLAWMENVGVCTEGKLHCPSITCNNKLGSFSWVKGCRCPCGTYFCPGFYLIPSKVDKVKTGRISGLKN